MKPNYAFKPTAEQAPRTDLAFSCRGGLTRRYAASIILTHFTLQPLAYSTIKKPCASLKTQGHLTVVHPDLNIQIGHTQRVLFNKGAARLDIITHQTREHVISIDGIIDGDP